MDVATMKTTTPTLEPALVPAKSLHNKELVSDDDCQAMEGIWAVLQHLFGSNNTITISKNSGNDEDALTVATIDSEEDLIMEDLDESFPTLASQSEDVELVYNPSLYHEDVNDSQDQYLIRIVSSTGSYDCDETIVMKASEEEQTESDENLEDNYMEYTALVMRRIPHTDSVSGIESQLWVPAHTDKCEHHTSSWIQASSNL